MVFKVVEDMVVEEGVLKVIVKVVMGDDEMVGKFFGIGDNRVEEIEEEKQGKNDEEKEIKEVMELVQGLGLEFQQVDVQVQKQLERMVKVDRENVLVLMVMLLGMFKDQMLFVRRRLVEVVLERGGELVVKDREGMSQVQEVFGGYVCMFLRFFMFGIMLEVNIWGLNFLFGLFEGGCFYYFV